MHTKETKGLCVCVWVWEGGVSADHRGHGRALIPELLQVGTYPKLGQSEGRPPIMAIGEFLETMFCFCNRSPALEVDA